MEKEYFKIMFAQLKLALDYDCEKEFLVEDEKYFKQMDEIVELINKNSYDVILFPELAHHKKYDNYFKEISKDKIIVFGSTYIGNCNYTVVYNNKEKFYVKKMFNSPIEPCIRYQENISIKDFLKYYLKEHTFKLKGKKFIVLNCAEYYKVAYYISRDEKLNKNLFAFLVPCANNKVDVFFSESVALHNHNENVYSFVCNSVATYKKEKYSIGESYVFGRFSSYERVCLNKNHRLDKVNNICYLDDKSYIVEGMYLYSQTGNYCRSDNYRHTPKNLKIIKMGDK